MSSSARAMPWAVIALGLLLPLGFHGAAASKEKAPPAKDPRECGRVIVFPFFERAGGNEYRKLILDEAEKAISKRGIEIVPRDQVLAAARRLNLSLDAESSREPGPLLRLGQELAGRYVLAGTLHETGFAIGSGLQPDTPIARIQLRVLDVNEGHFVDELECTITSRPKGLGFRSKKGQQERAIQEATSKALGPFLAPYKKK